MKLRGILSILSIVLVLAILYVNMPQDNIPTVLSRGGISPIELEVSSTPSDPTPDPNKTDWKPTPPDIPIVTTLTPPPNGCYITPAIADVFVREEPSEDVNSDIKIYYNKQWYEIDAAPAFDAQGKKWYHITSGELTGWVAAWVVRINVEGCAEQLATAIPSCPGFDADAQRLTSYVRESLAGNCEQLRLMIIKISQPDPYKQYVPMLNELQEKCPAVLYRLLRSYLEDIGREDWVKINERLKNASDPCAEAERILDERPYPTITPTPPMPRPPRTPNPSNPGVPWQLVTATPMPTPTHSTVDPVMTSTPVPTVTPLPTSAPGGGSEYGVFVTSNASTGDKLVVLDDHQYIEIDNSTLPGVISSPVMNSFSRQLFYLVKAGDNNMYLRNVYLGGGTPFTLLISSPEFKIADDQLALSPDGNELLMTVIDQQNHPSVYAVDVATGDATLLIVGASSPAYSPDGEYIAVIIDGVIQVTPSNNIQPTRLPGGDLNCTQPTDLAFDPDVGTVLFYICLDSANPGLFVYSGLFDGADAPHLIDVPSLDKLTIRRPVPVNGSWVTVDNSQKIYSIQLTSQWVVEAVQVLYDFGDEERASYANWVP